MPNTVANPITSGGSAVDGTVYESESVAPRANRVYLLTVASNYLNLQATTAPTVTGCGLTWVLVHSIPFWDGGGGIFASRSSVFRACGPAPTAGPISMTFGHTLDAVTWSLVELENVDASGSNGENSIVQVVSNTVDGTSLTATLAAFSSSSNATLGFLSTGAGAPPLNAVGDGFTKISDVSAGEWIASMVEFRSDNDTTVNGTVSAQCDMAMIAIELKYQTQEISVISLTTGTDTVTDGLVYTTDVVTPTAQRLVLFTVAANNLSAQDLNVAPTVSGCGLTWVEVTGTPFWADGVEFFWNQVRIFRACGFAPTTGALTITYESDKDAVAWSIVEIDGLDTGGSSGSNAIVQAISKYEIDVSSIENILQPLESTSNITFGAFAIGESPGLAMTPGSGFTEIHEQTQNFVSLMTAWALNDSSVDASTTQPTRMASLALELRAVGLPPVEATDVVYAGSAAAARNHRIQPFHINSIWNTPIGTGAIYAPTQTSTGETMGSPFRNGDDFIWVPICQPETNLIFMDPDEPATLIEYSDVAWGGGDRCGPTGGTGEGIPITVPMKSSYVVPNSNANESAAFLLDDGDTVVQLQPLARCAAGGNGTALISRSRWTYSLTNDRGELGAQGGSELSALGGAIRVHELRRGQLGPKHALKLTVYARQFMYNSTPRSRWPALSADQYASGWYGTNANGTGTGVGGTGETGNTGVNTNENMVMGALLAIPPDITSAGLGLETEPARQLLWTLQNFGAYICDDTDAAAVGLSMERGPNGSVVENISLDYGIDLEPVLRINDQTNHTNLNNRKFINDVRKLWDNLRVVTNNLKTYNDSNLPAGGGTPLVSVSDGEEGSIGSYPIVGGNITLTDGESVPATPVEAYSHIVEQDDICRNTTYLGDGIVISSTEDDDECTSDLVINNQSTLQSSESNDVSSITVTQTALVGEVTKGRSWRVKSNKIFVNPLPDADEPDE